MLKSMEHRIFREIVEEDSVDMFMAGVNLLRNMPCNRFTFPVRIRGKINIIHLFCSALEVRNNLLFCLDYIIGGLEAVADIDAESALRQVLDMADRSFHFEI